MNVEWRVLYEITLLVAGCLLPYVGRWIIVGVFLQTASTYFLLPRIVIVVVWLQTQSCRLLYTINPKPLDRTQKALLSINANGSKKTYRAIYKIAPACARRDKL